MDVYSVEYGNFIKERRLNLGLTQEEVANELGISQVAYGRYELGTREPKLHLLIKIADVLDFDLNEYFNRYKKK